MKWLISLTGFSVLLMAFTFQTKKDKSSPDMRLERLIDSLPSNWYARYSDTLITLHCRDSVYRIWTNHINAPGHINTNEPTEEQKMAGFKKEGKKKEAAFLSFRIGKKWNDSQIKKSNATNQKIYKQIKSLPKKHKIEHLYDAFASHKGQETYRGKTEEEKKRVAAYEAEKAQLEAKIIKFPDYCTSNYSVFKGKSVGMNSAYEDIYPSNVSEQAYHIINLANEMWDCNTR